jgi:hypothetical protein
MDDFHSSREADAASVARLVEIVRGGRLRRPGADAGNRAKRKLEACFNDAESDQALGRILGGMSFVVHMRSAVVRQLREA